MQLLSKEENRKKLIRQTLFRDKKFARLFRSRGVDFFKSRIGTCESCLTHYPRPTLIRLRNMKVRLAASATRCSLAAFGLRVYAGGEEPLGHRWEQMHPNLKSL